MKIYFDMYDTIQNNIDNITISIAFLSIISIIFDIISLFCYIFLFISVYKYNKVKIVMEKNNLIFFYH